MGVKNFRLTVYSERARGCLSLPSVVFGAESLRDLCVKDFLLDQKSIERIVLLKNLTSLRLLRVHIEDDILQKIISSCPLIETMEVKQCLGFSKIKMNNLHKLKDFSFRAYEIICGEELCSIEIHPPSLETIDISYGNIFFPKGADFSNLSDLCLYKVDSSLEHLSSCKFPSLEYLKFSGCDALKGIQLFIDAPNIRTFIFGGCFVPSISFATTTSSEWDSNIDLKCELSDVTSSWLLKLNELLNSLSQSEISLGINTYQYPMDDDEDTIQEYTNLVQDNGRKKPVVVESLTFVCHLPALSSLLNGLFCICRPRNIYNDLSWYDRESDMEVIDCVWKFLMLRESRDQDQFTQLGFRDLEEVRMEIYDSNRKSWHSTTSSELPNYREQREYNSTRFGLKWRNT